MLGRKGVALLALCPLAFGAEFVHFRNGVKLQVDRHEREGGDVVLYRANDIQFVSAASIARFEEILPPGVEPPRAAPKPAPARPQYRDKARKLIEQASVKHGLDPDFVHAVAQTESNYQQQAISHAGAIGIMQLMPDTAAGLKANPYDAADNVDAGVRLLRQLLKEYEGKPNGVALALAAYNAGECGSGTVGCRRIARHGTMCAR
ncbi:MAG: lytic transglycosylase domain-containing protein [Bryobacteraceae bacterium]